MTAQTTEPYRTTVGRRALADLPVLEVGLRPFFLLGAAWAVAALVLWVAILAGHLSLSGPYDPLAWHGHEMVYGFAGAIAAGFLLTAVPTWTGRAGVVGTPLLGMAVLWLTGRTAMTAAAIFDASAAGSALAGALDLSFFAALLILTLRQVVAGRNWRNLPITIAPGLLLAGSALVHLEALDIAATAALGNRIGIAVFVLLVTLIGGRIIPAFTRNWLKNQADGGSLPVQPNKFDLAAVAVGLVALVAWLAAPQGGTAAIAGTAAAVAHTFRLARWRGWRTLSEPLVWILHVAYAWVPVGFGFIALSAVWPAHVPESAGLHALSAGVMTSMMLAMMTRAALGHTGRPLHADARTVLVYLCSLGAAVTRIAASLLPEMFLPLIAFSGTLWVAAFGLYLASYAPKLCGPRIAG